MRSFIKQQCSDLVVCEICVASRLSGSVVLSSGCDVVGFSGQTEAAPLRSCFVSYGFFLSLCFVTRSSVAVKVLLGSSGALHLSSSAFVP